MRTAKLAGAALVLATLGLAACGGGSEEEPAAADANSEEGISVAGGWLALPAVSGNPGAVYFTVNNASERDRFVRAASVKGAQSAVLHQMGTWNGEPDMQEVFQIPVPAGGELKFESGGLHVMALDLDDTVTAGGTTEVTLTFIGGKTVTFPVDVRAAGDER